MIANHNNTLPLLQPYKTKSECRIFLENILTLTIPFTVIIGGIIVVVLLM